EGGNRFSGSLFAAGTTDRLQDNNFTQRVRDRGLRTATSIKNNYEISPSLGGPIVHDRVWFYAAAATYGQENYVGAMFYNPTAGHSGRLAFWGGPGPPRLHHRLAPRCERPPHLADQRAAQGRRLLRLPCPVPVPADLADHLAGGGP